MIQRRRPNRPAPPTGGHQRADAMHPSGGFTLVELMVVIVIISILLGFILNAAVNSVKRAQERATQALITKLENGLNDRLAALLETRPEPTLAHLAMAGVYYKTNLSVPGYLRAQTIAWYDYIKNEMPDTFYIQNFTPSTSVGVWPLNFAANPFPYASGASYQNYMSPFNYYSQSGFLWTTSTGIYGASYPIAAGIYKNLGYLPQGYDGIDNDHNGTIDDSKEGIGSNPQVPADDDPNAMVSLSSLIATRLANHKHITARAEVLYAILVEGQGPLGSVFNADEFTNREVQDTDGDGLPEFVDAWGKPLQFFRWPLLYHSDIQRGQSIIPHGEDSWSLAPPYLTVYDQREQDPLDLNQQLVAPMWWSGASGANAYGSTTLGTFPNKTVSGLSVGAQAFEYYFHRLTEPYPVPDPNNTYGYANYWDRSSNYAYRRAFFSKFLILSGGLDGQPGVFLYSDNALNSLGSLAPLALIANENIAMPFSATDSTSGGMTVNFLTSPTYPSSSLSFSYTESLNPEIPSTGDLLLYSQDDITNQNIQISVGIGGGQ